MTNQLQDYESTSYNEEEAIEVLNLVAKYAHHDYLTHLNSRKIEPTLWVFDVFLNGRITAKIIDTENYQIENPNNINDR